MKYLAITIIIMLVPLMLLGSFSDHSLLSKGSPFAGGKMSPARSWRVSSVTLEQYMMNTWGATNQFEMVYSSQYPTRLDTLKYYGWESNQREWVLYAKFSYVYDNTNEYATSSYVTMQQGGTWFPFMRSNFTYDNQHRLTYALTEMYNPQTQLWSVYMWTQVDFTSPTNYMVWQYEAETDNRTQRWMKMEFAWDAQGRIIEETDIVSADSITWVNSEKYVRTYHPHDTTTGEIFIQNFSKYMPLQNMLEDAYSDDFFGMLSYEMNKYWSGSAWVDTYQIFYTYDNADNLTQEREQHWMNNSWNNSWQLDYTFDVNGNQYQTTESYYDNGVQNFDERYTFSWEQTTANEDNTAPAVNSIKLAASPNPFGNELALTLSGKQTEAAEIRIYNARGRLVRSLAVKTNSTLSWDGRDDNQKQVPNGIYYLQVTTAEGTSTLKTLRMK